MKSSPLDPDIQTQVIFAIPTFSQTMKPAVNSSVARLPRAEENLEAIQARTNKSGNVMVKRRVVTSSTEKEIDLRSNTR